MRSYKCKDCGYDVSKVTMHHCSAKGHAVRYQPLADVAATPTATNNPKELEGMKKLAMHHIPQGPMREQHIVHNLGAAKYGHFNWREEGVDVCTYLSAARRHIDEFLHGLEWLRQEGVDPMNLKYRSAKEGYFYDRESGAHVLAHACACLYIIMDAQFHDKLIDNYSTPEVKSKTSGKPSNVEAQSLAPCEAADEGIGHRRVTHEELTAVSAMVKCGFSESRALAILRGQDDPLTE